ncbi:MAG: hypothetical protein ACYDAQ_18275 [Mycobacteriales bacterium]
MAGSNQTRAGGVVKGVLRAWVSTTLTLAVLAGCGHTVGPVRPAVGASQLWCGPQLAAQPFFVTNDSERWGHQVRGG